MARKTGNYDEYHLEWLKDPENAAAFLNAVIEDSDREAFLLALKDVAQAQGGMTAIAEKTHVSRSSLYKTLLKRGYPPVDRDEVYKEIFEQAENFKKSRG